MKSIPTFLFLFLSVKIFSQDIDTDGDGIIDQFDKCPKEQGRIEDDGCPRPKIDYKKIEADRLRQEKQFLDFKQNYNFKQLSDLIISNIDIKYLAKEILFISLKDTYMTDCGGYYSDDLAIRFSIINNIWNANNFSQFIKRINKTVKILTAQSYSNPISFDLTYLPKNIISNFSTGKVKIKDISGNSDINTEYISTKNTNEDIVIDYDYQERNAAYSTVYIQTTLKNKVLKAIYYYNFESDGRAKYFKFTNGKWRKSSGFDYENEVSNE